MLRARQVFTRRVFNAPSSQSIGIFSQKRRIWTSAAKIKTPAEAQAFMGSKLVTLHKKVMVPDFAQLGLMDSRQLFEILRERFEARNMQLIVASSNNADNINYDQLGRLLSESPNLDGTLVVKGSSRNALSDTPAVRQQHLDTIRTVRASGGRLLLPLRLDLAEDVVLRDIEHRLKLGADGFMTHPVFNVSRISPAVVKMLQAIVREHPDFTIRVGALMLSEEFYNAVESRDGKLVSAQGADLYPMRPRPADGDWEQWNRESMEGIRDFVKSLKLNQSMADSSYSRVGIRHDEESVLKIASIIEESVQDVQVSATESVEEPA